MSKNIATSAPGKAPNKNVMNKEKITDTAIDTIYYMGTKYVLHYGVDMAHVKNLNSGDIGVFLATDALYHLFFQGYFGLKPFENKEYDCEINKWGSLMAGVSLFNAITGRNERILDNLIAVGASGVVSLIIDTMRGKYRCV